MKSVASKNFNVFAHEVKVAIPGEEKYYYPDVFVTNAPPLKKTGTLKPPGIDCRSCFAQRFAAWRSGEFLQQMLIRSTTVCLTT